MGKIFYIMGKSSTGKDTLFKKILESRKKELQTLVMYTTRPIRAGETNGTEYFFVNEKELQKLEDAGKVIELRAYHTFHGIWKYFTVLDSQIDLEHNDYLMIGTPESYSKTKEYFGKDRMAPILIELDDGVRLQRALDREKTQKVPKYQELCRRFLADDEDFSEEKIKKAEISRRFYNGQLESCLDEILQYIDEERR